MEKHPFIQPTGKFKGCAFKDLNTDELCCKGKHHLIHKMPKLRNYQAGEVINDRYQVQRNGEWRRIKKAD